MNFLTAQTTKLRTARTDSTTKMRTKILVSEQASGRTVMRMSAQDCRSLDEEACGRAQADKQAQARASEHTLAEDWRANRPAGEHAGEHACADKDMWTSEQADELRTADELRASKH